MLKLEIAVSDGKKLTSLNHTEEVGLGVLTSSITSERKALVRLSAASSEVTKCDCFIRNKTTISDEPNDVFDDVFLKCSAWAVSFICLQLEEEGYWGSFSSYFHIVKSALNRYSLQI